jgi:dUTP pyrophosphatase
MDRTGSTIVHVVAEKGASAPRFVSTSAAGADIQAFLPNGPVSILPGSYTLIPTGLILELPEGYEGQVRPRSGLAAKSGVTVLNSPGTIDSDYRGEVKVILINHGDRAFTINHGDRIAQLVVSKVEPCTFVITDSLSETERGERGFGSTGV